MIGLFFFLAARPTLLSICIALPIVFAGEVIRTWASGCIVKNDTLTIAGPYGLTRNPLYLGNFFLGLGFVIMSGVIFLPFVFMPLFFFIYDSTITREEEFLANRYGDSFKIYKNSVPRFFPRIVWAAFSAAFSNSGFDWSLIKKHREKNTWLAILVVILLIIGKMWFFP